MFTQCWCFLHIFGFIHFAKGKSAFHNIPKNSIKISHDNQRRDVSFSFQMLIPTYEQGWTFYTRFLFGKSIFHSCEICKNIRIWVRTTLFLEICEELLIFDELRINFENIKFSVAWYDLRLAGEDFLLENFYKFLWIS